MRIINVLTIKRGIPVDIQSFLVEDDQLFAGIYDMAIRCGKDIINGLTSSTLSMDEELEFEESGTFIDLEFEVHTMYSYV